MKQPVFHTLFLAFAALGLAGGDSASAVRACGLSWSPSVPDALRGAAVTGRLAVVVFTGSDWSAQGQRLDEEVLMNVEFADRFTSWFVLSNADFPQRQQPSPELLAENTALATRHEITEWPTLLALRPDGREFGRLVYNGQSVAEVTRVVEGWQQGYAAENPVKVTPAPAAASASAAPVSTSPPR